MDLDPVRARCFVEVVGRGTVAAAASALGYTPSAVSQQVGKLERSLGVYLFDRVNGRLRPTPAARALVPHVLAMLDALESGDRAVREVAGGAQPAVAIAAFPSALVNVVAPVCARLAAGVGMVTEAEDDAGLRELSLGHVDVAIVQEHSHQTYVRDPRLRYHRLAADPFELVVPQGWQVSGGLSGAADLPWVVSLPGTPCRTSTEVAWQQAGIRPRIAAQAGELSSLAALIGGGVGVGLLPRLGIPAGACGIRSVPGAVRIMRTIHAATRLTNSQGVVASVVLELRAGAEAAVARVVGGPPVPCAGASPGAPTGASPGAPHG